MTKFNLEKGLAILSGRFITKQQLCNPFQIIGMWGNIELKLQKLFHIVSDPHWIALQGNHETGFN